MRIKFSTFDKVNQFVKATTSFESDIFAKSGRYVIDAKSLMGMYSLDLSKELELEIVEKAKGETDKLVAKLRELKIIVE